MQETAFHLLRRLARKRTMSAVVRAPASIVRIQTRVFPRSSTRAVASMAGSAHPRTTATIPAEWFSPDRVPAPYPLASRAAISDRPRFEPVDLSPYVNRPLNFRRGWLGDLPLRNLPPGRHEIHRVPFEVLGGNRRSQCGAIVFHSTTNATGRFKPLPETLRIPVQGKAAAVYVLHGCSYATFLQPFARYRFGLKGGREDEVQLVSLGHIPPNLSSGRDADSVVAQANIQDWWSDFPHPDFPQARRVSILEHDESSDVSRHVYLYTLEWKNPSPDIPLTHLDISVDSNLATTLGVIAITVLRP